MTETTGPQVELQLDATVMTEVKAKSEKQGDCEQWLTKNMT